MSMSICVVHCWFVDWLVYVGFTSMIIEISPFTLVLFMPSALLGSNIWMAVQQCIVTWIEVMVNFQWPTQQGWLSTDVTDRPFTGMMRSHCKKGGEQRDEAKAKDVEGQIEKMTLSELGGERW